MALLKIQIPGQSLSHRYLDKIFYNRFPSLQRITSSRFVPIEIIASLFSVSVPQVKHYLINSKKVHAYEYRNQILIHFDGAMFLIKRVGRSLVKQAMG